MDTTLKKDNQDLINKYKNEGYKNRIIFENSQLVDTDNQNHFNPEDIKIIKEHKLEVNGKPSDRTILIVFKTRNHTKGLFIIDETATENLELKKFFKSIPDDNPYFPS